MNNVKIIDLISHRLPSQFDLNCQRSILQRKQWHWISSEDCHRGNVRLMELAAFFIKYVFVCFLTHKIIHKIFLNISMNIHVSTKYSI